MMEMLAAATMSDDADQWIGDYRVTRVLRGGDAHKARVLLVERDGEPAVIKDLAPMGPIYRSLFGRRMLAREMRALEVLDGSGLAPRLLGWLSRDAAVVEYVAGANKRKGYLRKRIDAERMPRILESLEGAVASLHSRGLVHLDLRQRKNILVRPDDTVVLIDFESSWCFGTGWKARTMVPLLSWVDRGAVLKWKHKFARHLMTDADWARFRRQRLARGAWPVKKIARGLRRIFLRSRPGPR